MTDVVSISPTLVRKGARICCRACGEDLAPADAVWKEHVVLDERPLADAAGAAFAVHGGGVLLRRFYCPGCGATLDAETALPGEPFLVDRVAG